jgi:hypothetical protein
LGSTAIHPRIKSILRLVPDPVMVIHIFAVE